MTGSPPPPIFIVGAPRSGTTLLARILDSHSKIAIYHETQYYPLLRADLHRYGNLHRLADLTHFIDDLRYLSRVLHATDLPPTDEFIDSLVERSFEGVLAALLQFHARQQGKLRGGDKTPRHHAYLGEILARLPGSPVIFVLRDPRDTVHSIRRAFRTDLKGAVWMWREAYANYEKFRGRVHAVRYEELVREPEKTIEAACAYLGEAFESGMLRFFERVPEKMSAIPHHAKLLKAVDSESIGKFATMPLAEVKTIEAACADGMEALGYPFIGTKPQPIRLAPPSKIDFLRNRLRYYGWSRRRWRRGWARWKIVLPLRLRYSLSLAWLLQSGKYSW